ncbi:alpha/beta fold hydrolase [Noviherbaspirillum autotrophicum]|uniref:Alpha/beta hydrolase n=1 Tax=Noviherbaspirillum autotrophicum TaxID=709839 RepID=A0A0C2BIS1_9BURK|nr:alpha/beta fold hydrolase [Noviherbaspirillum autotrophicum]KIF81140.1 alpha/beta hydrolase [Noviherbaspirillum autotrophicum]
MPNNLHSVTIAFSEVMKGYVSAEATTFAHGYADGEAAGHSMSLHVTVSIGDLASFLQQPDHAGALSGYIDCPLLGGRCPVRAGTFRLLADSADLNRKVMYYQAYCETPQGEPFTFIGEKQVQHNAPLDLWRDTTTLFVNVFRGHADPARPAQATHWACGILSLGLTDFMRVLRGMRATAADGGVSLEGLAAFGAFFAGKLWDVYGPALPPPLHQPVPHFARFTSEGVADAAITVHPFSTADGLGLTLTNYRRATCDDVVLVVHGLTTSSDMFIMPEHRNLVQTLLDDGFGDVWMLDHRGSNRFPYNLSRSRYNLDDIALFDHPAAVAELRRHIGPHRRIHVIAHCVGALTMAMSLFGKAVQGIRSVILNSVALTPHVPAWSKVKLAVGPWASDYLLGIEYYNPRWRRQRGWSVGTLLAAGADLLHRECTSPECHMLSFMWGSGDPALFNHENMAPETHDRLGDLFGGISVHYYRHVNKMVRSGNTAVKFEPGNPRYAALPDNYMECAADIPTPTLLIQGQDNRVFADSIIQCHARLEKIVPGRHRLHVFPGYGHQDIFMGKDVAADIFPRLLAFLREHARD